MTEMARFGPAGSCQRFAEEGNKSSMQMPGFLEKFGLNAYEYQCGKGVNISEETARAFGKKAKEHGIALSIHAPYYISMSGKIEEKRLNSIRYVLESAEAADWMGADRIIIHTGGCAKMTREEAMVLATDTMTRSLAALDEAGLSHVIPCPETMGKMNQLGTLTEVLTLCKLDERMLPCIDFGHLNCRTHGGLAGIEDYAAVLDEMENTIGIDRARRLHVHFSKIEYAEAGEVRHLTFADEIYGPEFDPLAELFARRAYTPRVICESAGTQTDDALTMKKSFEGKAGAL